MEDLTEQDFSTVITLVSLIIDHDDPVIQHDSALSGRAYYNELLQTSSRARFHDIARMDRDVFLSLLHIATEEGGLKPIRIFTTFPVLNQIENGHNEGMPVVIIPVSLIYSSFNFLDFNNLNVWSIHYCQKYREMKQSKFSP
jgi:hypothetical protein